MRQPKKLASCRSTMLNLWPERRLLRSRSATGQRCARGWETIAALQSSIRSTSAPASTSTGTTCTAAWNYARLWPPSSSREPDGATSPTGTPARREPSALGRLRPPRDACERRALRSRQIALDDLGASRRARMHAAGAQGVLLPTQLTAASFRLMGAAAGAAGPRPNRHWPRRPLR